MGLLNANSLNDYLTKTIPQNARNLWGDIQQIPAAVKSMGTPEFWRTGMFDPERIKQARTSKAKLTPEQANQMAAMALDFVQPMGGLLAHTVYHGSPHKFNKFDMSKIGTGEGAQAYGHGLYMAESPAVAQSYADVLGDSKLLVNGKPFEAAGNTTQATAVRAIAAQGYDESVKAAKQMLDEGADPNWVKNYMYDLNRLKGQDIRYETTGNLYKVDIPDESIPRMLDWDKPLSEQSDAVYNAIRQAYMDRKITVPSTGPVGPMLLDWGKNIGSSGDVSDLLAKQGIPGIRYKDGMSRGTDAGTSNFVLFDDQLARILEINGQPTGLLSWADEAAKKKKNDIPQKLTSRQVRELIDRNSPGEALNFDLLREAIGKNNYQLTEYDVAKLLPDDLSVDASKAVQNKGPIIIGKDGKIIDGRHRAAAAKKQGLQTINAYVPFD